MSDAIVSIGTLHRSRIGGLGCDERHARIGILLRALMSIGPLTSCIGSIAARLNMSHCVEPPPPCFEPVRCLS